MDLPRRIARQPGFRLTVAGAQLACALAGAVVFAELGAPTAVTIALPLLIAASAAGVAVAPTETMDGRWFHALPLLIVALATAAMWAIVPQPAPVAVVFVLLGAVVVFTIPTWSGVLAQLTLASALLLSPVVAGQTDTVSTLTLVAGLVGMWTFAGASRLVRIDAERTHARLEDLSRHDAVTGLLQRWVIDELLERELARHAETREPLALVLLDLRGFRRVNDLHGHQVGDEVLHRVAAGINEVVRGQDHAGRQGGDEFCVIAPETDLEGARGLAQRIRDAIADAGPDETPVDAAVGIAVHPADGTDVRRLFEAATSALRADAAAGRRGRARAA